MENIIQQIISRTKYGNIIAWVCSSFVIFNIYATVSFNLRCLQREFTLLLLPLLSRKLKRTVPSLLTRPSLLAHTIYQALTFDATIMEEGFTISGTSASGEDANDGKEKWDGVSEVILGNKEWFDAWMDGEKKCELLD